MKGQKGYALAAAAPRHLSLSALARKFGQHLKRWYQLAEQRRRLASLDEAALKDLGLSRADVLQEFERPFWDDPLAHTLKNHQQGR
ncbi:MAG TPA: DUF1127 domain-containing protein [Pseudomonas sp.]|nr:DUF1127 domain-containing protein [Pseudomonas sp.]